MSPARNFYEGRSRSRGISFRLGGLERSSVHNGAVINVAHYRGLKVSQAGQAFSINRGLIYGFVFSERVRCNLRVPAWLELLLPRRSSALRRAWLRASPPLTTSLRPCSRDPTFGICIRERRGPTCRTCVTRTCSAAVYAAAERAFQRTDIW